MFSKKCMVVGSLLVMAAQTATAVTCASITTSSTPNLATVCGAGYTGVLELPDNQDCANTPCSGANDAATCCVSHSPCSGMALDLKDQICGQNGYSGEYVDNPGTVKCAGVTCANNDAITCCKPAALCSTISAPATFCSSDLEYAQPRALIDNAFCLLETCATSGDTSADEARCCVPRANCDTISTVAATFCAGDAYTGAFKSADVGNRCAGAACVSGDAAACCDEKAPCDSLIDNGASPDLAAVCGGNVAYSGAVKAGDAHKCATATCQTSDAAACCKPATAKCNSITGSDVQTICAAPGYTGLNGEDTQTGNPTVATLTNEDPTVEIHT